MDTEALINLIELELERCHDRNGNIAMSYKNMAKELVELLVNIDINLSDDD